MTVLSAAFSVGLLLQVQGAAGATPEGDFGQARIEAGREAFAEQRYPEAVGDFRIASFALLDQPSRLLESLALLAIAQSAAGRPEGERKATLERFLLVEERFAAYREADLRPEERRAFQAILRREVPGAVLADGSAASRSAVPAPMDETPRSPATLAPAASETPTPAEALLPPSETPTPTSTPLPPTAIPTPIPTDTPTPRPTWTAVPTNTKTRTPTGTPVPPSATAVPTDTRTQTPTRTPVPPSATRVPTAAPTRRPTAVPSATRVPTWTPWPTREKPTATAAAKPAASDQRDRPLRPIVSPNPVYPPDDLKARIRGVVVLRVLVSDTGVPRDIVVVERARGHLTEAAVEAVRGWIFEPAVKNGRPVQSWTVVSIPFEAIPFPGPSPTLTPVRPGS